MVETESPRRSERWAADGAGPGNRWAVASLVFAALGLLAVALIVVATARVTPFDSLSDPAGYVLYGAVPSFGVLALFTGLMGRTRSARPWMAWTGVVVGSALVALAVIVLVIVLNAFRTLG